MGAGCSVSAGIPASSGFCDEIKKYDSEAYDRATVEANGQPGYGHCMMQLSEAQRRDLIEKYVAEARVNWAHIAVASLMQAGYIDRVVTPNFDNLMARAAAMLGCFPGVYDMTLYGADKRTDMVIRWDDLPPQSIFHIHGQSRGFVMLHADVDLARHTKRVSSCFDFRRGERAWIVAGYSGENDPVFTAHIARTTKFDDRLYWVSYRDQGVPKSVADGLFSRQKDAFHIPGMDADEFFIALARNLDVFPPPILSKPFSHLVDLVDSISPLPVSSIDPTGFVFDELRKTLKRAVAIFETGLGVADIEDASLEESGRPTGSAGFQATDLLLSGRYDELIDLYEEATADDKQLIGGAVATAYSEKAFTLLTEAQEAEPEKALQYLQQSEELYKLALGVAPSSFEACNNLGWALLLQAELAETEESIGLYEEAIRRFERARELAPNETHPYNNLAATLIALSTALKTSMKERESAIFAESGPQIVELNGASVAEIKEIGDAVQLRSRALESSKVSELLTKARIVAETVENIAPGEGAYNLACIAAIEERFEDCRNWLEVAIAYGKAPNIDRLTNDPDLSAARTQPWFDKLLSKR